LLGGGGGGAFGSLPYFHTLQIFIIILIATHIATNKDGSCSYLHGTWYCCCCCYCKKAENSSLLQPPAVGNDKNEQHLDVRTSISRICINKNPTVDRYSWLIVVNCWETIDFAVLNCFSEGLSNLNTKQYKVVSQILYAGH